MSATTLALWCHRCMTSPTLQDELDEDDSSTKCYEHGQAGLRGRKLDRQLAEKGRGRTSRW